VSQLQDNLASLDLDSREQLKSLDEQAESNTDSSEYLRQRMVRAIRMALVDRCCSNLGHSGRIVMRVPAFKLPACPELRANGTRRPS